MDNHTQGFGMIPNWLVRESDLSAYALLVYIALSGRMNKNGEAWPSLKLIAKEARCSISSARRALKELETAGMITVVPRTRKSDGAQTSNVYRIHVTTHAPVSDRRPPTFTENSQEVDTSDQKVNQELKPTQWSGLHSDSQTASYAQVTFMSDCYALLHQEKPPTSEIRRWEKTSSAEIHEEIRSYWQEIEQGNDDLLSDAYEEFGESGVLSKRAIDYIKKRLELA